MAKQKRSAENELTHDNWQDEEEAEEMGEFKKAPADVLKNRVIKTAKRRVTGSEGSKTSAFAGFGGFGSVTNVPSSTSPFSFLTKISSTTSSTNGSSSVDKTDSSANLDDTKIDDKNKEKNGNSVDYYAKIKSLNESVAKWIKTHVDKDPICILTPIFKDYEKHLNTIEAEKDKKVAEDDKSKTFSFGAPKKDDTDDKTLKPSNTTAPAGSSVLSSFKFGGDTTSATAIGSAGSKGFSFGTSVAEASTAKSGFSFGSPVTSTQKTDDASKVGSPVNSTLGGTSAVTAKSLFSGFGSSSGSTFSFGSSQPFSFGNVAPPKKDDTEKPSESAENENEEPPKNEFVPVVEENSIYSKRCKVFIKGGADYSDRGVGTLYLKKVDDSEKIQLIVRAETNLGNILLNLILTEGLPASRLGKNNVMLVCIPTPDAKPPPTSVLLRVKTGEEADNLLAEIKKHI